jgi:hypothetical protein
VATAAARPPIVDAHVHCLSGAVDLLLRVMDLAQVERAVVLAWPGNTVALMEKAACMPRRLRVLVAPDLTLAGTAGWDGELALVDSLLGHAAGIKLYKQANFGLRNADGAPISLLSPELEPLWAIAARRGCPVLVHYADPLDFWRRTPRLRARQVEHHPESRYRGSRRIPSRRRLLSERDELLHRHPDVRFVGAHLSGFPATERELARFLELGPTDTSAALEEVLTLERSAVDRLVRRHHRDLLWGSDLFLTRAADGRDDVMVKMSAKHVIDSLRLATAAEPVIAPSPTCRWTAPGLGLTGGLADSILGGNALRLYWSENEP